MKAKVIIENSHSKIILTPDTIFDRDILEKVYQKKESYKLSIEVYAKYSYGSYTDHKIEINIDEILTPKTS